MTPTFLIVNFLTVRKVCALYKNWQKTTATQEKDNLTHVTIKIMRVGKDLADETYED